MITFIRPDNHEPAEFVAVARGHVCLRTADTVTPAVRWYKLVAVDPRLTDMVYGCAEPPRAIVPYKPLTLYVTPDLLPGIDRGKSSGVEIRIAAA